MNLEMAYDLYAVRESLEGLAARLATEKINGKAVTRLESLLKKQHQIVQLHDVVAYSKLDFEFHGVILGSYWKTSRQGLDPLFVTLHQSCPHFIKITWTL
jgi:hypothetical protein